ncbi:MAG TPA: response regulator [Candidatus Methylomirabilis sp.]|nr:response regulator [Candidatus Methylomirabilis sp.]
MNRNKTILIVDDHAILARAYVRRINAMKFIEGCSVLLTEDPKEALVIALAQPHKLFFLLTDTDMPRMTGAELIRDLRLHLGGQLKRAVLMSGDPGNRILAAKVQADMFLGKPPEEADWEAFVHLLEEFASA